MKEYITLIVDNEDVNCNRCDNCLSEEFCSKFCGPTHCWSGYERSVEIESEC